MRGCSRRCPGAHRATPLAGLWLLPHVSAWLERASFDSHGRRLGSCRGCCWRADAARDAVAWALAARPDGEIRLERHLALCLPIRSARRSAALLYVLLTPLIGSAGALASAAVLLLLAGLILGGRAAPGSAVPLVIAAAWSVAVSAAGQGFSAAGHGRQPRPVSLRRCDRHHPGGRAARRAAGPAHRSAPSGCLDRSDGGVRASQSIAAAAAADIPAAQGAVPRHRHRHFARRLAAVPRPRAQRGGTLRRQHRGRAPLVRRQQSRTRCSTPGSITTMRAIFLPRPHEVYDAIIGDVFHPDLAGRGLDAFRRAIRARSGAPRAAGHLRAMAGAQPIRSRHPGRSCCAASARCFRRVSCSSTACIWRWWGRAGHGPAPPPLRRT